MIVISDTSPLINLAWIGRFSLLEQLYSSLLIPPSVWQEAVQVGVGQPGSAEIKAANWIQVVEVQNTPLVIALQQDLDAGEAEAIALALEKNADLLLIDERLGRKTASHFGLSYIGLIGVLISAKRRGLLTALKPELDKLRQVAGFYISEPLYHRILEDQGEI
jgi:predicted nucleic acid-binding protein